MKTIFVFGAGASAASAGILFPLGKELVWTYYQDCCDFRETNGDGQIAAEDIARTQELYADLLKFLESMI